MSTDFDDFDYSITWQDANRVVAELGFVEVFSEDFADASFGRESQECFKVFWRDGLLLSLESHGGRRVVNSSNLYYNWKPDVVDEWHKHVSGGHFYRGDREDESTWVWSGYHDSREALRRVIENFEDNGVFLPVWVDAPFLALANFGAKRVAGFDFKAENARVISHFPQHVKDAIAVAVKGE